VVVVELPIRQLKIWGNESVDSGAKFVKILAELKKLLLNQKASKIG